MAPKKENPKLVFLNPEKKNRADGILKLLARAPKTAEEESQKARFTELLNQNDVNLKDAEETVLAIYKLLGGAVRTYEQVQKVKAAAKSRAAKDSDQEEPAPAEADDDEEDEDEDDEDDK